MQTIVNNHRSKRGSKVFKRQLLSVAGVFLFIGILFPSHAGAIPANTLTEVEPVASPLEENKERIKELKESFEVKRDLIDDKAKEVEVAKQEVTKVAESKQAVVAEVNAVKSEIEVLKVKIAEKKAREAEAARLAALRIVNPVGYIEGNTYYWGQCTWYAKNRRMDLPNNLGNADTWYSMAQAQGWKVGSQSRKHAIAMTRAYMHVAFVEEWYPNGTVLVSEMNMNGVGVISSRVAPESEFLYIYEKQ